MSRTGRLAGPSVPFAPRAINTAFAALNVPTRWMPAAMRTGSSGVELAMYAPKRVRKPNELALAAKCSVMPSAVSAVWARSGGIKDATIARTIGKPGEIIDASGGVQTTHCVVPARKAHIAHHAAERCDAQDDLTRDLGEEDLSKYELDSTKLNHLGGEM
eukprot:CAMPEP_0185537574 /NCGR_PEP_ID=MMETSP1366-20130426/110511_1 /TAXON_ID=38817 /ORGANISM="Gephyrocapsa oceanica, Strain RCC1303" /LENGTH=159 /DNA_ID=CAMNT_0028149293 /DNA_START=217 /DNA_END=695 /DNA_ORIENTATION=-